MGDFPLMTDSGTFVINLSLIHISIYGRTIRRRYLLPSHWPMNRSVTLHGVITAMRL